MYICFTYFGHILDACIIFTLSMLAATIKVCCLLITFSNASDPDQDRQNINPDLEPNRLTL